MCTSVCSKTCRNHSCLLSASGIGDCTDGCVPGYQGPRCSTPCDSPGGNCTACPGGCDGGYCQLGSSCVSGCVDSYYGTDCKSCSSRCKSCNRMTGSCRQCHPEYFGPHCGYSCDHCLGFCEHGCTGGCLPGFYDTFCDKTCSDKCGPDPNISTDKPLLAPNTGVRDCHRDSGDCIHGCDEGWYGRQCFSPCSPNCVNQRCDSTGVCVDGCVSGHFGRDCKPCSVNCLHSKCQSHSGSCTDGCARGFYGGLCQHTCEVCLDGVCDQKTATCTEGCHPIRRGCDSTCTFNCSIADCLYCNRGVNDSNIVDLKIGLSTVTSMFVVIVLLALSRFFYKHLRNKIQSINVAAAPSHDDQVLPDYCEIRDEDVAIMCELPAMNRNDSVTAAAALPVLAECFAPDCDDVVNDVAIAEWFAPDCVDAVNDVATAECFAPDCDDAVNDVAIAECFAPDCDDAVNDVATSEPSAVDDNTYTKLMRKDDGERLEKAGNYLSPIDD
ncbi:multiple epidermal growth factor-like domains protein 10 isoform X2 [Haliotis rubra]|uniref:multiple epidermal growth factor-like domains protein 10 isoform X2 n=1 Tax=Haliotis rubra TaxID=36100 RepID=UPI001EE5CE14|nr:multiple epidermal growth factor-like domains protein 10 isoform X2 [Haliotis rubra]